MHSKAVMFEAAGLLALFLFLAIPVARARRYGQCTAIARDARVCSTGVIGLSVPKTRRHGHP
jgi:hypothetical protein